MRERGLRWACTSAFYAVTTAWWSSRRPKGSHGATSPATSRLGAPAGRGGTLVKETFDRSEGRGGRFVEALGFPERDATSMSATSKRLEGLVVDQKLSKR